MNNVKGLVLLDGGYMGPFQKSFDDVKAETYGFLYSYVFKSWEQFLDEERKTSQLKDEYIELACRSSMMKKGDKIELRVDPESALKADLLLNKFPKQNLGDVLNELRKVLKVGGLFYMGVYGWQDSEGVWEEDTYQPNRFFSFYLDQLMQQVVGKYFEIVYFKTVNYSSETLHFQSTILHKNS